MKLVQRVTGMVGLLTLVSAVSACMMGPGMYKGYDGQVHDWPRKHYLLDIETQPAGAAVTVNHEYVGKSPVKWLVPASIARSQGIVVEALPSESGQESQHAVIATAGRDWDRPIKVYLAMNLEHVTRKHRYEVDVR